MRPGDITFQPIKGAPPTMEWISVDELKIDEAYQRAIDAPQSQRLILDIACNWDWSLCGPLNVSRRPDGSLYVLDGQHRLAGAKMRSDIPHLPAIISRFAAVKDEAVFFVKANTARKNPTPLDKFNARCLAGDETALAIRGLVQSANLSIARSTYTLKPGEVGCVAVLQRLFKQYGAKLLSAALVNMAEAFPSEPLRVADELLPGLCLILYQAADDFDPDLLVETLASREQIAWFGRGAGERDPEDEWPDEVFRDIILEAYFERLEKRRGKA